MKTITYPAVTIQATGKTVCCRIFAHNSDRAWDVAGKYMTLTSGQPGEFRRAIPNTRSPD